MSASFDAQTVAWLCGEGAVGDLGDSVSITLASFPEKPIIAYLDNPSQWPVVKPSWVTPRVWPDVQAYRNPAESLGAFQTRVEGYLNRIAGYGIPYWFLEPAFYTRNGAVPVAEIVECMPLYDLWLRTYPIVGMTPFADRRPTGMLDNPELRDWCRAFLAATPARPSYFDYWTPSTVPPSPPPSSILDGWYGQWSPSGLYFACGSQRISVATVAVMGPGNVLLGGITDVNEGIAPQWFNPGGTDTLLLYNRSNALLTVNTPPPFAAAALTNRAFNAYGAGGGVWAGFTTAGGVHMEFSDGPNIAGRRLDFPAGPMVDQSGRAVYLSDDTTTLYLRQPGGAESVLDTAAAIFNPHITTQGAVWQRFEGGRRVTYGWRGTSIELLQASAGDEFWAIPIVTPTGPYLLRHDASTLYLGAWGQAPTVITSGVTDAPHAIYTTAGGGGFLISWSRSGVVTVTFVPLAAGPVPPPGPPPPPTVPPTPPPTTGPPGPGGAGTLTAIPVPRFQPRRKAVYPHVPQITDLNAQQSVKLLWDRMHAFETRLVEGDVAQRFEALQTSLTATNTRLAQQAEQLEQNPAEGLVTSFPEGGGTPGPGPSPGPGTSGTCADSPGTGHFEPGGALTEERARKISCGTGDEWSILRAPTATLADRETNAETLTRRVIWHLAQGGYTAGRQQNPSTAISKDKFAIVLGTETRAFDIYQAFDDFSRTMVMQWIEVFPAVLVADAGIAD